MSSTLSKSNHATIIGHGNRPASMRAGALLAHDVSVDSNNQDHPAVQQDKGASSGRPRFVGGPASLRPGYRRAPQWRAPHRRPSPRRAALVLWVGGWRGEKRGAEDEINPFAPDSVPFLALPPVPSGGGFVV